MPSVVGLLEQHELAARRRVVGLREEADRIQAELAMAEQEWWEWTIARGRVGAVLSAPGSDSVGVVATDVPEGVVTGAEVQASPPLVVRARSQVPVWRMGWPGRHCRWTTSTSWPRSRIGSVSVKGR